MAVSIAVYSVVVRNETIAARFPGGIEAYRAACPNHTWCTDETICRVGFMAFDDLDTFVGFLEQAGVPQSLIALTRQDRGLLKPCAWLSTATHEGHPIAWLAGTEPGVAYIPESDMNASSALLARRDDIAKQYDSLGLHDGVESFRNRETGKMLYVGRSKIRRWVWPFRN